MREHQANVTVYLRSYYKKMAEHVENPVPGPGASESEINEYARQEAGHPIFSLPKSHDDEQYQEAMKESGPYLTLGIQMAMSIAAFAGIGYWIDSVNKTSPLWLGILAATGAVLSLTFFIVTVLRLSKNEETKRVKK